MYLAGILLFLFPTVLFANPARDFSLKAPPDLSDLAKLTLWGTSYYLPYFQSVPTGFPLRDIDGNMLGPKLPRKEWCIAALEGSTRIKYDNKTITYNFAGLTDSHAVDCSQYYKFDTSHTKFRKALGKYGDGVNNWILVPMRTIAVDSSIIPYGTVLYVPKARGIAVALPDGRSIRHDGYFFAGDKGGGVKGCLLVN